MEALMNKLLLASTLGDFAEVMKSINSNVEVKERKLVYGISGLAAILDCSVPTAQKLKNEGKVPYFQEGRKIVFDVDQVLDAIKK